MASGSMELVEIGDTFVRLLKSNGNYTTVPLRRLSDADQDYVQQIASQGNLPEIGQIASSN